MNIEVNVFSASITIESITGNGTELLTMVDTDVLRVVEWVEQTIYKIATDWHVPTTQHYFGYDGSNTVYNNDFYEDDFLEDEDDTTLVVEDEHSNRVYISLKKWTF